MKLQKPVGKCIKCDYVLANRESARCSECGWEVVWSLAESTLAQYSVRLDVPLVPPNMIRTFLRVLFLPNQLNSLILARNGSKLFSMVLLPAIGLILRLAFVSCTLRIDSFNAFLKYLTIHCIGLLLVSAAAVGALAMNRIVFLGRSRVRINEVITFTICVSALCCYWPQQWVHVFRGYEIDAIVYWESLIPKNWSSLSTLLLDYQGWEYWSKVFVFFWWLAAIGGFAYKECNRLVSPLVVIAVVFTAALLTKVVVLWIGDHMNPEVFFPLRY